MRLTASRLAQPALPAWSAPKEPLHLVEQTVAHGDPDPKAMAGYGLLVRQATKPEQVWLRFVTGRPVSAVTTQFARVGLPEAGQAPPPRLAVGVG